ncbi:hypothetical protein CV093_03015 [Oceanobacillus sp. 143]|uniref:Holin n=1 Tax=Oceanobacillus zhaokaii TaxID=2052660 RepID=A0A345PDB6_9BACI|nr:hypothetical protein [Oceanobacillus zhaokaii]AXI07996.1 hypothetical protein CUC15_02925 [Oceanobacillus zhaokaii]QGS68021.1 hypothetical protein CV093_03015 [Oceanobacillus sp. 143]
MEFPIIYTNFWDGVIAVPAVVLLTQCFKLFPIPRQYFPTIASIIGFIISIFISHRGDLWAGIFMGAFYGAAAVGTYSSLKTAWLAFKNRKRSWSF